MGNLRQIPFTELFERVQQNMRDTATGDDVEARYKGYVNVCYLYVNVYNKFIRVTLDIYCMILDKKVLITSLENTIKKNEGFKYQKMQFNNIQH